MQTHKISSRATIITQRVVGKICSIFGNIIVGLGLIGLLVEITDEQDAFGIGFAIFCLIIGGLFIYSGIRIRNTINRFKHYVSIISIQRITSLETIAAQTGKSTTFVRDDLQKMINNKFFSNASIDPFRGEILIAGMQSLAHGSPANLENYTCGRCGGSGVRERGSVSICEYCGSVVYQQR